MAISSAVNFATVFFIWALSAAAPAIAEESLDIGQVLVTDLGDTGALPPFSKSPMRISPPLVVRLDRILNTGAEVWQIVKDNAPLINVKKQYAAALPEGTLRWDQLAEWQPPKARKYQLIAKSIAGIEVVRLEYLMIFHYGGRYQGKGRYLSGVSVEPTSINVRWGYRLNVDAKAVNVVNVGTKVEPVGAMTFVLSWKVETAVQKSAGSQAFFVDGAGTFQTLGQTDLE